MDPRDLELLNAKLDGELAGDALDELDRRLQGEPRLASAWTELQALDEELREVWSPVGAHGAVSAPAGRPTLTDRELVTRAWARAERRPERGRPRIGRSVAALAAMLLLGVLVGSWWRGFDDGPSPRTLAWTTDRTVGPVLWEKGSLPGGLGRTKLRPGVDPTSPGRILVSEAAQLSRTDGVRLRFGADTRAEFTDAAACRFGDGSFSVATATTPFRFDVGPVRFEVAPFSDVALHVSEETVSFAAFRGRVARLGQDGVEPLDVHAAQTAYGTARGVLSIGSIWLAEKHRVWSWPLTDESERRERIAELIDALPRGEIGVTARELLVSVAGADAVPALVEWVERPDFAATDDSRLQALAALLTLARREGVASKAPLVERLFAQVIPARPAVRAALLDLLEEWTGRTAGPEIRRLAAGGSDDVTELEAKLEGWKRAWRGE